MAAQDTAHHEGRGEVSLPPMLIVCAFDEIVNLRVDIVSHGRVVGRSVMVKRDLNLETRTHVIFPDQSKFYLRFDVVIYPVDIIHNSLIFCKVTDYHRGDFFILCFCWNLFVSLCPVSLRFCT